MSTVSVAQRFAVCVHNPDHAASLERLKMYPLVADPRAEAEGLVRVIDESGESYLYPSGWFVPLPQEVVETVLGAA